MEATADPQIGGKFWDVYGRLLPQPHTVTVSICAGYRRDFLSIFWRCARRKRAQDAQHALLLTQQSRSLHRARASTLPPPKKRRISKVPFCLPQRLLTQLHNDGMATRAKKQVDRLHSIYPDLMQTLLSHPKTAVYAASAISKAVGGDRVGQGGGKQKGGGEGDIAPMALVWAFAMVRSRAFAAGDDRFSFVPFLVSEHCSADRSSTCGFPLPCPLSCSVPATCVVRFWLVRSVHENVVYCAAP